MSEAGRDSSPAERDFQALADNIPTLCWMANADGWITWYNRRWYAFTGTTPAEMEGWGWQSVHDPDRLQDVLARWQASIATGRAFDMTFPLRAADGRYRPFLTRAEPVRDEAGRVRRWFGVNIDISEQADAEAALRAERDRSLGIIETMREGFLLLDRDFVIRQINAEGLRMEGRPASEIVGRSHWDVYPGTEHHEIGRLYKQAFREGVPIGLDHRYVWPDGHAAWIEMRAYPAPDRGSLAIFYREVTAAKEAEAALRASEAQFRAFAQAMPNHVWAGRADGQLYWFNAGVYAYSGAAPGTLDGIAWTDIVHPDDLPAAAEAWGAALAAGAVYETEFRIRRADGAYRWFLIRAEPIRGEDGAVNGWIGTNTDIHDQKLAQGKLSLFNETLAREVALRTAERDRMWRLSTDLLLVAAFDTSVTAINPAWTRVLGWTEDEVVGQPFIGLVHPDWRAATLAEMGRLSEGATTFNFENRARHRDGSYRTFAWTAVPGEGFIHAVGRDITPEREAADALARAEEQLRQAQKMEAVGQLTGGVAHDFNNLLTVIRSSVDLMQRPDLPDARRQRYLAAISDTVTRAAKLTGQLLAFARRQALQPEAFDAGRAVRAVGDMLGTLTGTRIRVDIRVPETPCFIHADPSQFDTAIVNMAVNARDAMEGEGRLTITVRQEAGIPALRAHPPVAGGFVSVAIADTGSGIGPENLDRIFEPFFTTKAVGQGTGLGLSQVFGFAKQSGGEVRVESTAGQGTTFTLYLPHAAAAECPPEADGALVALADGHGTRILLVEDNDEVGRFTTQALSELGYSIVWAGDAEAALVELDRDPGRFDVVFSDVVMPGMGGIDLATAIRERHPDLPVILTSGYSHVLAREGTCGFELLHKPYSVEDLSRILHRAASLRRASVG